MENAKLYCNVFPKNFGKYEISVRDTQGKEITGILPLSDKSLDVGILEINGDKTLVLLPKGLNKETAWIKSAYLN